MARYFFDLSQGSQELSDELGAVCANDRTAVRIAWKTLAACVAEPTNILPWQSAEINVRREDGTQIGRVSMTVEVETQNPATADALAKKAGDDELSSRH